MSGGAKQTRSDVLSLIISRLLLPQTQKTSHNKQSAAIKNSDAETVDDAENLEKQVCYKTT